MKVINNSNTKCVQLK